MPAVNSVIKMPAVNSVIKWLTGFKHNVIHFGLRKLLMYAVKRKSVMHLEVHRQQPVEYTYAWSEAIAVLFW